MTDGSNDLPRGMSGPRRTTQEPSEISAANEEASRLADVLGVSSTSRSSFFRDNASPIASNASTPIARQRRGLSMRLFGNKTTPVNEDIGKDYQALSPDGITKATPGGSESAPKRNLSSIYSPPTRINHGSGLDIGDESDDNSVRTGTFSVKTAKIDAFDTDGNLAPYREGPYDVHHDYYGRQTKRRWCKEIACKRVSLFQMGD